MYYLFSLFGAPFYPFFLLRSLPLNPRYDPCLPPTISLLLISSSPLLHATATQASLRTDQDNPQAANRSAAITTTNSEPQRCNVVSPDIPFALLSDL